MHLELEVTQFVLAHKIIIFSSIQTCSICTVYIVTECTTTSFILSIYFTLFTHCSCMLMDSLL
jgi:hypothetical protein